MRTRLTNASDFFLQVARLIRLPNLLIIALTQVLLRYCLIIPFLYPGEQFLASDTLLFYILVGITVFIAAGGYVINDYFDLRIDRINRPGKLVVGQLISSRGAIKLHMTLNILAIAAGFYVAYRINAITFGLLFPFISGLLWIYSARYKKALVWGNVIVAALSAFVILIIWLFEFFWLRLDATAFAGRLPLLKFVTDAFLAYALFAFLVTLVREIIKDMEDAEGDAEFGGKTLAVVTGHRNAGYIAAFLTLMTMLLLAWAQYILLKINLNMVFWYLAATVQIPAFYLLFGILRARQKQDYSFLSILCKLIMIAGVLSMEVIMISI